MRIRATVTAICVALSGAVAAPSAAAVDPACERPPAPAPIVRAAPWAAQDLYNAPEKLWPFSTGARVTVAVVDSGVDSGHFQLRGRLLTGYDFVRDEPDGDVDCLPHGTAVASIIAAKRVPGIGFFGLAPGVTILPVRIVDKVQLTAQSDGLDPGALAAGINYAVDRGADVVNVSAVIYDDDPRVAQAVETAVSRGVVVVAAAGNAHPPQQSGAVATDPALTPYPAAYDGVIGVGAIGPDRQRVPSSQIGPYVDLVAPGAQVTAAAIGGHNNRYEGTSFATAFVSASVALVLARRPSLLGPVTGRDRNTAVTKRLLATASPVAGAPNSLAYGHGVVDPYRALTEPTTELLPADVPGQTPPPRDIAAERLAVARRTAHADAVLLGTAVGVLVLVVLAGVLLLPRAHRRRWRTGRCVETLPPGDDDGPEFLPGHVLFESAKPTGTTSLRL